MSQPINVDDVLELVVEGSCEQQPWALVRHYRVASTTGPDATIDALITFWVNTLIPAWEAVAHSLWVAECMTVFRSAPQPRNAYFTQFVPAVVGDITTDGLPPQNAVLVRLQSDEVGARCRGRAYLTGCPEASTNGGVLLASVQNDWQTVGDYLSSNITDGGDSLIPCVFSRTNYNPAADPPQAVTAYTADITASSLQGNIATIRRRRTKRSSFSA